MTTAANAGGPSSTRLIAAILIAAVVVAAGVIEVSYMRTATTTITIGNTCTTIYPAQPLGASIRVLNDSALAPVAGALVTATAPVNGVCGSPTPPLSSIQFTTNATEWYSLPTLNRGTYQVVVTYLGRSYGLTWTLGLSLCNCATLYLPSGRTNVTTTGASQEPCQSAIH